MIVLVGIYDKRSEEVKFFKIEVSKKSKSYVGYYKTEEIVLPIKGEYKVLYDGDNRSKIYTVHEQWYKWTIDKMYEHIDGTISLEMYDLFGNTDEISVKIIDELHEIRRKFKMERKMIKSEDIVLYR